MSEESRTDEQCKGDKEKCQTKIIFPSWMPLSMFFVTFILIGLKISGTADYGWIYAFMPLWLPLAFVIVFVTMILLFVLCLLGIVLFFFIIFMTMIFIHDLFGK